MFVGYPDGVEGYKLWYTEGGISKSLIHRDVVFREDQMFMRAGGEFADKTLDDQRSVEHVELKFQNNSNYQEIEPEVVIRIKKN